MIPIRFLCAAMLAVTAAAQINPGNLVVVRLGDGIAPLSNASQALFLDEYTTSGTFVQSVALPVAANGTNLPIACSGTATSEGNLQLAENGQYLVLAGYGAIPGVASIAGTASATTPRVIARIGLDASIDTSTSLTNAFSGNNIRSATTPNGVDFFAAGANGGIQYVTLGANTATALNTTLPLNTRTIGTYAGQLYCSSSSGAFLGVSAVGTGIPTTAGQTITALPGMPTTSGPSTYDFFFADPNTLYLADDRATAGNGGIHKYTLVAGTWTFQYILNPATTVGCRGLTGVVQNGIATLFATNTLNGTNALVTVTDTGATSVFTTLATAATNTVFRGVRLVPASGSIARIPHGCGPTSIVPTGTGAIGTTVTTTLGNLVGVPFVGYGFAIFPSALCSTCTIGHEWAVAQFGGVSNFVIPNDPNFAGLVVGIQGADLLGLGGCSTPQVTLTDTLTVTIH